MAKYYILKYLQSTELVTLDENVSILTHKKKYIYKAIKWLLHWIYISTMRFRTIEL